MSAAHTEVSVLQPFHYSLCRVPPCIRRFNRRQCICILFWQPYSYSCTPRARTRRHGRKQLQGHVPAVIFKLLQLPGPNSLQLKSMHVNHAHPSDGNRCIVSSSAAGISASPSKPQYSSFPSPRKTHHRTCCRPAGIYGICTVLIIYMQHAWLCSELQVPHSCMPFVVLVL